MRLALAIIVLGLGLAGAVAVRDWHPTHSVKSIQNCDPAKGPVYDGCPTTNEAALSPNPGAALAVVTLSPRPVILRYAESTTYWWKSPLAVVIAFLGLAAGVALVKTRGSAPPQAEA